MSALGPNAGRVDSFIRSTSFASFKGLTDKDLTKRANAFGCELGNQPIPVKFTAFINALSIVESPLVVSSRLTLRRPIPEDVAEYIVLDEFGGVSFPLGETHFSVVGEFLFDAISTGVAQGEFIRTIGALCLFRVGGIATNRYEMRSKHSYMPGVGTISGGGRHSRFTYALSTPDIGTLNKYLHDVVPLLPDPFHLNEVSTERDIAYTRYRDALFQDGPSERAITSAITALEALFLTGKAELMHRLAQRVSVFLRVLGTHPNPENTYDNVKTGYDIRSTFIHGSSLKPTERPQADALAPVLLEYARVCTLAFFQMTTSKTELLKQIDQAMINPVSMHKLESSLTSVVHK